MRVPEFDVKGADHWWFAKCVKCDQFEGTPCFKWSISTAQEGFIGYVYSSNVRVEVGPINKTVSFGVLDKIIKKACEVHEILKGKHLEA